MSQVDLHMHSSYSIDGTYAPKELIEFAKQAKLRYVALCDHNYVKGVDEMIALGKDNGIQVVPGIECDTKFMGLDVHLLGLGIDHHAPYFQTIGDIIEERERQAIRLRIRSLNRYFDAGIDEEAMMEECKTGNPFVKIYSDMLFSERNKDRDIFKPYQPGGSRDNPGIVNFHWDYCSAGSEAYVAVEYPSLEDTVREIHKANGVAIIAHPWRSFFHQEERLAYALEVGVDGLEAYSNYHNAEHNAYYHAYCKQHGLLLSCGSDFHGELKPKIRMGEYGCTEDDLALCEPLLQRVLKRQTV